MLTVKQTAELLAVSPETVIAWIGNCELAAVNVATVAGSVPRWRIRRADIELFIAGRRTGKQSKPARYERNNCIKFF